MKTSILLAELVGTMFLVLIGNGVVANVSLAKSKGNNAGWIVIAWGWGIALFIGAYVASAGSGAHLNPAVTIGLAVAGNVPWSDVPQYIIGQFIGAFIGSIVAWLAYKKHFDLTEDKGAILGAFSNGPAIRDTPFNLITEIIGTFVLVFGVFAIKHAVLQQTTGSAIPIGLGPLDALPVGLLLFGIALALGGPTGFALNPARDLAPRFAHFLLPIKNKGGSDWAYSWIPVVGPIIGGILAALLYIALGKF